MARKVPTHNTYEASPDDLINLSKTRKAEAGKKPRTRTPRAELLHNHEWHLDFLEHTIPSPRNLILPPPYPPSRTSVIRGTKVSIDDIRIEDRSTDQHLLVRTIVEPYVHSSCITIAEDEVGNAARVTICNFEDSSHDPMIPLGSILVIKQPCWSRLPGGDYHIRVDHPSDLLILDQDAAIVPAALNDSRRGALKIIDCDWKKRGDTMFLEKRFRKALEEWVRKHLVHMVYANIAKLQSRDQPPRERFENI